MTIEREFLKGYQPISEEHVSFSDGVKGRVWYIDNYMLFNPSFLVFC